MKAKFEARDYGYTVMSRFEVFLRNVCIEKLDVFELSSCNVIPSGVFDVARNRNTNIESFEELLENIDFIHLKEIFIYKDNYSKAFSEEIINKQNFIALMDSLYLLRCKIAHIRDYFTNSDLMQLISEIKQVCNGILSDSRELIEFVDKLLLNPDGLVEKIPITFFEEEKSLELR